MIDASDGTNFGKMLNKTTRELTSQDVKKMKKVMDMHRQNLFVNEVNFAKTVSPNRIQESDYSLSPGQYVDVHDNKESDENTRVKIEELSKDIGKLFMQLKELEPKVTQVIQKVLKETKK